MLSKRLKDYKLRKKFKKSELKRISFKYNSSRLSTDEVSLKTNLLFDLKSSSSVKIRRRCVLTNRARGVHTKYNISRVKLRELFQFGIIPGFKKSV